MVYFGSPSAIASTGQESLQLPHMVQASEISYAMVSLLQFLILDRRLVVSAFRSKPKDQTTWDVVPHRGAECNSFADGAKGWTLGAHWGIVWE
jgi:hypothetical protein